MNTLEEAFVNIGMDEDKFMRETRRYSQVHPSNNEDISVNIREQNEPNEFAAIIPPPCVTFQPNFSFAL